MKPTLLFEAPVNTVSGYGHHARDILRALMARDEYQIKIMDLRWGSTPRNALNPNNPEDKKILDLFLSEPKLDKQPEVHIQLTVPNEFRPIGKYSIGITAGMETDLISSEWVEGLNRMDLIIVPSVHSKKVFESTIWRKQDPKSGQIVGELKCTKPVEVLFEGARLETYHRIKNPKELPEMLRDRLNQIPEKFNFLFVGHWLKGDIGQDRKDVGMLIKTFFETFKDTKNPPGLILKTSSATFSVMDREEILRKIDFVRKSVDAKKRPNIYLLHGELTDEEMNALYNHPKVKAHVSFTKGEGFGRPLLEASLSGKPVIAPAYSGHLDFLAKDLAVLLPGKMEKVHPSAVWDKVILKESSWFTTNYSYASRIMKDMVRDYQKYQTKAKRLAVLNASHFSFEKMCEKFDEILKNYIPEMPEEVSLSLPQLPNLGKGSGIQKRDKIELPKLKRIDQDGPDNGSGQRPEDEMKVNLPKLKPIGGNK